MIRVKKGRSFPTTGQERGICKSEAIERRLNLDQNSKCYVCEGYSATDYEIDHLRPKSAAGGDNWENLFLICRYCNARKSNGYRKIFTPDKVDIEDEIRQEVNFSTNQAEFSGMHQTPEHEDTIALLNRIFNGVRGIRKVREEKFFKNFISKFHSFLDCVNRYKASPTHENEQELRQTLSEKEEFLGFKYWVIKQDHALFTSFHGDILWNKGRSSS